MPTAENSASSSALVAVADASEFLIKHNKNALRAACDALGLPQDGSKQDLHDRLVAAARDVASLTMQHSKTELMTACDALGLSHEGSKSELGALLHAYLLPAHVASSTGTSISASDPPTAQ